MQPEQRDTATVLDMYKYALRALSAVEGITFEELLDDINRSAALERHLEIIGEAATRLSHEFRSDHPEIAWRRMVGLRNILIHAYGEVDLRTLWRIAHEDVPELVGLLEPLLPPASD